MDKYIIFYGAGKKALSELVRLSTLGVKPNCFADQDAKKHYTKIADIDVLPLEEALENSKGNYIIYITMASWNWQNTFNYLKNEKMIDECNIDINRIDDNFYYPSFSEYGEDIIVNNIFNMIELKIPTYITIGAFHPVFLSNTYSMYLKGSRGINVEPNPQSIKAFNELRPLDTNINCGCGVDDGIWDYYLFKDLPALNTFSYEAATKAMKRFEIASYQIIKVRMKPLMKILKNNGFPHFLDIDTEGFDEEVLLSCTFDKNPLVICIEGNSDSINNYLMNNEFSIYNKTPSNRIYVRNWIKESLLSL